MNLKRHIIAIALSASCLNAQAEPLLPAPIVPAKSYTLVDISTGTVLAENNATVQTEIASLTKVMTAFVTFSELRNGTLSLTDEVLVSKKAWKTDGSKMFIEVGKKVAVEDLIKGILVVSGNDASVAIAEHIAGSEERFVELMNNYAKAIGMKDTVFANATGLPSKAKQHSSANDLALLASTIFKEFPQYTHYFDIEEFTYNDITQPNRNRLLNESPSYNGMKTGYTGRSGYSLISSFEEDDRNIIAIILNSESVADRFMAAKTLTTYGFRRFKNISPIVEDTEITTIPVTYGTEDEVPVYAEKTLTVTLPLGINPIEDEIHLLAKLEKNGKYEPTLFAPVKENYVVGKIQAFYKDREIGSVNLITKTAIPEANPIKKLSDWVKLTINQ